jgi:hypothetical protein
MSFMHAIESTATDLVESIPTRRAVSLRDLATGIAAFSIGLGLAQLLAPRQLARVIGVSEHAAGMRALGLREIASGIGVLAAPREGLWARVAGDAMDLALLASALGHRGNRRGRILAAAGAVVTVGVLDYLCARELDGSRTVRALEDAAFSMPDPLSER